MAKHQYYRELARMTLEKIGTDPFQWCSFLETASRLYKYNFMDQVMIYCQRPEATACAGYDLWTHTMGRYVKKGTKGIGLLDDHDGHFRLRYVYDLSDTGEYPHARPVHLWKFRAEHEEPVNEGLRKTFLSDRESLIENLIQTAGILAQKEWEDIESYIQAGIDSGTLKGYNNNIEDMFVLLVKNSTLYMALARCGLEPNEAFAARDFTIEPFYKSGMIQYIGIAVNNASSQLLKVIGALVQDYERRIGYGNSIQAEGERLAPGNGTPGDGADGSLGQIRTDAQGISEGVSAVAVLRSDVVGQADRPSGRNTENSPGTDRPVDAATRRVSRGDRGRESQRPNTLGRADEQLQSPGRGNDLGAYIQLNLFGQEEPDAQASGSFLSPENEGKTEELPKQPFDVSGRPIRWEGETIVIGHGEPSHELDITVSDETWEELKSALPQNKDAKGTNYAITDDRLGHGNLRQKYTRNIQAIRTLKTIEQEGRTATKNEQETLVQYVGWGALPQAFDPDHQDWQKEYMELKGLLSDDEYASARGSTLNAHYTSPLIIREMYRAINNMGFTSGNILDPACGTGHFFGSLPETLSGSRLYGVELDSITGRIARLLYPEANILVAGFETTDRKDFFDIAVGNVPFGQYQVNDRDYNKLGFSIHNYFFAKSLDQVRPGGIIAYITSRYTMDAQDESARKYIAQRAELLGAIRLPNHAFKANAGTEAVADILFLQRRLQMSENEPEWVHAEKNEYGTINTYFIRHPDMVLGTLVSKKNQYGRMDYTVEPSEDGDFAAQLHEAIDKIHGDYQEVELLELGKDTSDILPADPNVKNYSYTKVGQEIYYRKDSSMLHIDLNQNNKNRMSDLIELRDCVYHVIEMQMDAGLLDEAPELLEEQRRLNLLYDDFAKRYGLINAQGNRRAFCEDSGYYLLCALEILDEDGQLKRKADIFTKRTIKPHRKVDHVDTSSEALALSIGEKARVDLAYMAKLTGKNEEIIVQELYGTIFKDPETPSALNTSIWRTADEYLSGNVREKLKAAQKAAENDPLFLENVKALEAVQPKDLDASEIQVKLGATWIPQEYIQQFMYELLETPQYLKDQMIVSYIDCTNEWKISNKNAISVANVLANTTYGTRRINAYKILEDSLNLKDVRVYDTIRSNGKEKRVLNPKETMLAAQKQQAIRTAFKDWIWQDPERRQELVKKYNGEINNIRPREYDGSHIVFGGMNPVITLRSHQVNAVARILYGGNTLLAHEVGAGKTYAMIAAAMESKRLGLCHKSIFVVPNHLTGQWGIQFLKLYPAANILVTTKKDFETGNRKTFCGRIATGDYDAVIIGHSQFERISMSRQWQERILREQIDGITDALLLERAEKNEKYTIKTLERTKRSLEAKLKALQETPKDDVVTFEELGVDRIFVDEAHYYKNLYLYTKMRNVAGLSVSGSQRATDMFNKCRYMDQMTHSKGVVFATATPVSNSMTEIYTMQRYLQYDTLQARRLQYFDSWASCFGETTTALELAPEGSGYRSRTRFNKFYNLPELMNIFKEVADIKTADQLDLPRPKAEYRTIIAQPTDTQKKLVKRLSERASKIHDRQVPPSVDNMLKVTMDGRKLGLDQRLINPFLADEEQTKTNLCVNNVFKLWEDTQDRQLTQIIFCDISTPRAGAKKNNEFTIYNDIKEKLLRLGVPEKEIAFAQDSNTEQKKKLLYAQARHGKVRILLGSTDTLGTGTDIQDRVIALHDLDCPWRPGDLQQRLGRGVRQGNMNESVNVYRYVTEGTFDAYLWQTVENKQKYIGQVMTSKDPIRACEDVDETALSFAEIKALCAGDQRIKEKMDLDVEVTRLKLMKTEYQKQKYQMEDRLREYFPERIRRFQETVTELESHIEQLNAHPDPQSIVINGRMFKDRKEANRELVDNIPSIVFENDERIVGEYRGLELCMSVINSKIALYLRGKERYGIYVSQRGVNNVDKLEELLNRLPDHVKEKQTELQELYKQQDATKEKLAAPFEFENELKEKELRLVELNIELDIDSGAQNEALVLEDDGVGGSALEQEPDLLKTI